MPTAPRWFTDTDEGHSHWYVERFRAMSAEGADLEGEARLIDAMAQPRSRVLDAGCGPGRTSGALCRRGHEVVGVDVDPVLIDAARADHPGPSYVVADLASLDLPAAGIAEPFDAAVCAGNVLAFVAADSEAEVLSRIRAHLRADAFLATGFHVDRYDLAAFYRHAAEAGFVVESRFATWDVRPWRDGADFAVTILRNPSEGNPA
ncbi:MAG: class I SAM-dependent methyltransferase [Actinomycetota bacterium]|nr:class I SAM-dependent methyltransferase [Actinomycetota bacterium]